ncbi:FUSC family protein [Devosia sp. FKR38]|uniref:FUSC family protein n=1 Tax=Devosia sp. FKR38 TaxID=2562312 RepID=UPI0010C0FF58|nr:FUSC family protein [Devosia sp. FKR38]
MPAPHSKPGLAGLLLDELRPFEGRLGAALRMALCCVIVVAFAMSQHVPEAAVSCYLIFFANRDNAASGILIAIGLIIGVSVGILLGLVFLQLAADEPMVRLGLMAFFTFAGMYFSVATKAGPIAATVGFVFAFVMTLNDFVPVPELLSRGISWMWVVVFIPMAVLILVNALLGPNPAWLVRHRLALRLRAAADLLGGVADADARVQRLLEEDAAALAAPARLGALLGYHSKQDARRLAALMPLAQDLLAETRAAPRDRLVAQRLDGLAEQIASGRGSGAASGPLSQLRDTRPLAEMAERMADIWVGRIALPEPETETAARSSSDMASNPAYLQFALKAMLAVLITYTIYTAGGWFEIHTAMITCFYVALGTTGETLHKAGLRIAGCLIGAAMGIGSIVFLMPQMTDIGQLLLLVGVGSFIAAWVAQGSTLIQYMGWQMALAFFLCVLQGFGPSFDIDVATNRIVGILIGNVVVAVVFLWLWPTSVAALTAGHLARAVEGLGAALRKEGGGLSPIAPELREARRLSRVSAFEPGRLHRQSALAPHAAAIMTAIDAAGRDMAHLRLLQQRPRYLLGAPRCVKAATLAQQASVARFLDVAAASIVLPDSAARSVLDLAAQRCKDSLGRLEKLVANSPKRAAWWHDLDETTRAHRALARDFSRALETL